MEQIAAKILLEGLAAGALAQCDTPVPLVTTDSREVCPGCILPPSILRTPLSLRKFTISTILSPLSYC